MASPSAAPSRHVGARVVAVLLALAAAILLMGLIDLFTLPGWVDQRYEWEVPLEASWGALFTFFLAGAYVWVAIRPRAPWPALVQLAVGAVSLAVAAGLGTDWRPLVVALGVVLSGLLLWWMLREPARRRPDGMQVRWVPLAVALLGLPLWLPYVSEALERSRAGVLGSVTQGVEHWPVQGAAGIAVVLAALLLAVWEEGRPLLRVAVSLSAVYIGMAELAFPDRDGAMGSVVWGVGVTLWGLLVALVAVPPAPAPDRTRVSARPDVSS